MNMDATDHVTTSNSAADAATMRRNQMIAIAMLVVFVFAGAGFGFWRWQSNRAPDEPLMDPPLGRLGGGPIVRMPEQPRDGIRKTGSNLTVRAGAAQMVATPQGDNWRFTYRYQPGKFSSPDQPAFFAAKYQSMSLGLTEDQKTKLNALPPWVNRMMLRDDDQKKLESLWKDYYTAGDSDKPAREQALVDALKDVGARSEQPTLAETDSYVAQIQAILTPEQIAKLRKK